MRSHLVMNLTFGSSALALFSLFIPACGSDDGAGGSTPGTSSSSSSTGGGGGGGGTGGEGGSPSSDIHGSDKQIFVTPSGEVSVGVDLSAGHTIAALVPNGSGGFDTFPGTGTAEGSFTIPAVPEKPYYLRLDDVYYALTERSPELGGYRLGRPDVTAATMATPIDLHLTGLDPLPPLGYLALYSLQISSFTAGTWSLVTPTPVSELGGETSLDEQVNWFAITAPANLWTASDTGKLVQLHTRNTGGLDYLSVNGSLELDDITMTDGQLSTIAGALLPGDPANDETASLTWTATAFTGRADEVHPNASLVGAFYALDVLPSPVEYGLFTSAPDLVLMTVPDLQLNEDIAGLSFSYNNPFGASLARIAVVEATYRVRYLLPGATTPRSFDVAFRSERPKSDVDVTPVDLTLSAPRTPVVDGQPLSQDQTLADATPTLSWSAPEVGQATYYTASIFNLYSNNDGVTRRRRIGDIHTDQTSLTVPPGMLMSGQTYVVQLRAAQASTPDFQRTPNREGLLSSAVTMSGMLVAP